MLWNNRLDKYTHTSIIGILLGTIALFAFLPHFFSYTFSLRAYIIVFAGLTLIYILMQRKHIIKINWLISLWMLIGVISVISLFHSSRNIGAVLDVISLLCCCVFTMFYIERGEEYGSCLKVIYAMAVFHAFGVLIQVLMPGVYSAILRLFPSGFANAIRLGDTSIYGGALRGFTTNTGSTAIYLCAGIIECISLKFNKGNNKKWAWIPLIFMFLALAFTGKRGHTLFLLMSLLLAYLLPEHGASKVRKYFLIVFFILIGAGLFIVFGSYMSRVPIVGEAIRTVTGVLAGDDVSSLRIGLSARALQLFKTHPLFGIGWGDFRNNVVGAVSLKTELDTHNIYLQLLCENGLIGAIPFYILFVAFWLNARNLYCDAVKRNEPSQIRWNALISFSFIYQTFFILYGMTGNPLYDQHSQILYALSCGILLSYRNYKNSIV